ncbi:MAG: hypothetical protein ACFFAN_16645 [Promethearchaeota archaeon]
MGKKSLHNNIIKSIAKNRFNPFGILQDGNSRTFLDDNNWFTIIIEFQPSSWSRGTYLNVGANFHFYPRDYFTFEYGSREVGFKKYNGDDTQFSKYIEDLCDIALKKVKQIRNEFRNPRNALKVLKKTIKKANLWNVYNIGILFGINQNFKKCQQLLSQITNFTVKEDWHIERKQFVEKILKIMQTSDKFKDRLEDIIIKTRKLKKLPQISKKELWKTKDANDIKINIDP